MKKILVTNTYFYKLDPKQWGFKKPYPPLGTIQIATLLSSKGYQVQFYDNCLSDSPQEILNTIEDFKPDILLIYDDGFNYLTKMCLSIMKDAAFKMAEIGKKNGAKVVISSSDSSDQYEHYLQNNFDFVLIGEGDATCLELFEAIYSESDFKDLSGLAYLSSGNEVTKTPKRAVLQALDDLPIADWSMVDLAAYKNIWVKHHGYFSINIATTRGCPYKCNWCAKPIYGNRYNSRSPEHVIKEIELLVNTYEVDHFWMCDDIFGLKPGWVQEFNQQAKLKELSFKYMIQSRVDLLLKDNTIDALVESGLETVWLGAESGSQQILDAMDKGITVDQIFEAVPKLQDKGVRVALFLQFGYLGETINDIRKTIDMVLTLMPDEIGISVSYPLPGTKFYDKVKDDLQAKANWIDSDDLDLMFSNTYPPKFYKKLHRYMHNRHRLKKGRRTIFHLAKNPSKVNSSIIKQVAATGYHLTMSIVNGIGLRTLSKAAK